MTQIKALLPNEWLVSKRKEKVGRACREARLSLGGVKKADGQKIKVK